MPFSQPRRLLGLLGWFLLVPGGLTALGALWILSSSMNLWAGTHSVTGRVVGHEQVRLQNHQRTSVAQKSIVEFTAQDGRHFRVVDPVGRQLNAVHKVGEPVKVRYPARKPEDAQIASSVMVQGFIGGVMLLFGAAGVLAGGLILRLRPRAAAPAAV